MTPLRCKRWCCLRKCSSIRREDARVWAQDAERDIDRGATPQPSRIARKNTFGDVIHLHIDDMKEVGKAPGRSKAATFDMLKRELGKKTITELDRAYLVKFGRTRAGQRRGSVTLSMDMPRLRYSTTGLSDGRSATITCRLSIPSPVPVHTVDRPRVHPFTRHQRERSRLPTPRRIASFAARSSRANARR